MEKQRKQKIESNWYKQSKDVQYKKLKSLIEHEKNLQQEIKEKQSLLEKQLIIEQKISQEKLLQLKVEKDNELTTQMLNTIQLQKEQLESILKDNKQLYKEKQLYQEINEKQLHQESNEKQLHQEKIQQLQVHLNQEKTLKQDNIQQLQEQLNHEKYLKSIFKKEKELAIKSLNNIQLQKESIETELRKLETELRKLETEQKQEKIIYQEKIKQLLEQQTIEKQAQQEKIKQLLEQQTIEKQAQQEKIKQLLEQQTREKQLLEQQTREKQAQQEKIKQLETKLQHIHSQLENKKITQQSLLINNIPTIYIVYQYSYNNNEKVTGFGDFIRGCFFMLQFSDRYNINVDFDIFEHPIKQYLEYFVHKYDITNEISNSIAFFKNENYKYETLNNVIYYKYHDIDNLLLNFIKQTKQYEKNKYIYLINHPDENNISETHREKIRKIINPTQDLMEKVELSLLNLKLNKYQYRVIHLRMNDDSFYGNINTIKNNYINDIIKYITTIKQKTDDILVLITNNNIIKKIILNKVPQINTIFHDITHIADKSLNNDANLMNTLKEFYIMSFSNFIYSFSVYDHGSGFSKWCSVAYNIPYVCIHL